MWLRDSGILNKLYDHELNTTVEKPDPKVRVNKPLNIYQLATAFIVVAVGLIVGILAFFVEYCCPRGEVKRKAVKEVCSKASHLIFTRLLTLESFVRMRGFL